MLFFVNEEVLYEKRLKEDKFGKFEYEEGVIIPAKHEEGTFNIIKGEIMNREIIIGKGKFFTYDKIKVGDKLNGEVIDDVKPIKDLTGLTVGYKSIYL